MRRRKRETPLSRKITKLAKAFESSAAALVIGPYGAGKSTLLRQYADSASTPVYQVSFSKTTDYVSACSQIFAQIDKQANSSDERSPQAEVFLESSRHELESKKALLCLHNLDNVQDWEKLLQYFLESLEEGSLLASSVSRPELHPVDAMELHIVDHIGLDKDEYKDFIASIDSEAASDQELVQALYGETKGNPFSTKLALTSFKLDGVTPKKELLKTYLELAEKHVCEKIWKELPTNDQNIILEVASLDLAKDHINTLLAQLPSRELALFESVGLVYGQEGELVLRKEMVQFLESFVLPARWEEAQKQVCSRLESDQSLGATLDRAQIYACSGDHKKAAESIEPIAKEAFQRGYFIKWLNLTDSFVNALGPEAGFYRIRSLQATGQQQSALAELQVQKERLNFTAEDEARLSFTEARLNDNLGFYAKAARIYEELAKSRKSPPNYRKSSLIFLGALSDTEKAQACYNEAETILDESSDALDTEALLLHFKAVFESKQLRHAAALSLQEKSIELFKKTGNHYGRLIAELSKADFLKHLGKNDEYEQLVDKLLKRSQRMGHKSTSQHCATMLADTLVGRGQYEKAAKLIEPYVQSVIEGTRHINVPLVMRPLLSIEIKRGRPQRLKQILTETLKRVDANLDQIDQNLFLALQKISVHRQRAAFKDYWMTVSGELARLHPRVSGEFFVLASELALKTRWLVDRTWSTSIIDFNALATEPVCIQADAYAHIALWELTNLRPKAANANLEKARQLAEGRKYHATEFRIRWTETLLRLHLGELHGLDRDIEALDRFCSEMDEDWEKFMPRALRVLLQMKLGKKSSAEKVFGFHPYAADEEALRAILGSPGRSNHPPSKLINDFWEKIIGIAQVQAAKKIVLQTAGGKLSLKESSLNRSIPRKLDLLLDERDYSCKIGNIRVDFSKKPLLYELLRHFLNHHGKTQSKESLTTYVWKEKYEPLVHDPRIYNAVSSLRKIFKDCHYDNAVVETGGTYHLDSNFRYALIAFEAEHSHLSDRQRWVVAFLKENPSLTRSDIESMLKVSSPVLKRDLKELADQGFIKKLGTGRATHYQLAS